jgi:hypothetical protein
VTWFELRHPQEPTEGAGYAVTYLLAESSEEVREFIEETWDGNLWALVTVRPLSAKEYASMLSVYLQDNPESQEVNLNIIAKGKTS